MKRIAIDIDNTICNTTDFYGKLALKYDREVLHKNNEINYNKTVPRSDNWSKEELSNFVLNVFNKESINIPVKKDASKYINKLKELGYEIIFITNRGLKEDDHTDLIIEEYLNKNNIPYDKIITRAKEKYKYLNDISYFIDDDINNCIDAIDKTKVILMITNKTKDYKNDRIFKANNFKEIYDYIKGE